MDFVFEWLVQIVVEIVGQLLADFASEAVSSGVASALASRIGRWVFGAVAGLGFGVFWGHHLSRQPHYPRLLWASLVLGCFAALLAIGAARPAAIHEPADADHGWRRLVQPPWRWDRDRFLGLAFINAGLALGIAVSFQAAA